MLRGGLSNRKAKSNFTMEPIPNSPPPASDPWSQLVRDGVNMFRDELPSVVEIVEGIICERSKLSIVCGAKGYKTWITIGCALSVSHGTPFLGKTTQRRRVLYVNLELKPDTFARRFQQIARALRITIEPEWFLHLPLRGQTAGSDVSEIISRIIRVVTDFKAEVVILDPLFKLNIEGDENAAKDQTLLGLEIDRLTTEAGCTVITNDHSGKGDQSGKDPLDVIRGSSAKGGDLDAAMVLRRHKVKDCFRVDLVHRELPPVEPFVIGWNFPLMELRPDLDADALRKTKGGRGCDHDPLALLAAIAHTSAEEPISVSAWATAAGIARQTLNNYLPQMCTQGWIATIGKGNSARRYITEAGKTALAKAAK